MGAVTARVVGPAVVNVAVDVGPAVGYVLGRTPEELVTEAGRVHAGSVQCVRHWRAQIVQ
jgi:hypothetical protein